jgi:drug/metabolite transporter (DMT)-like permease
MQRQLSYGLLVMSTVFWGVTFVVTKVGTEHFSAASFLTYRFLLAAILLAAVFPQRLRRLRPTDWSAGLTIGGLLFVGTWVQAIGLRWTSASNAGFIAGLSLVFLPLFKYLMDRTPLRFKTVLSGAVALTGLASLSLKLPLQFNPGDALILLSAVIFAWQILLIGRHANQSRFDPIAMTWVQLLGCGLLSGAYALIAEGGLSLPSDGYIWQAIAFTGVLCTAVSYSCQNFTQQHLDEQQVALIFLLEPIFSCIAAILWLHEPVSSALVVGGCLILLAIAISELPWTQWRYQAFKTRRNKVLP